MKINLTKVAKELGTTSFRIVDAKTKIIKFEPSRQMRRKIQRELEKQSSTNPNQPYYPKSIHLIKKS